MKNIRNYAKIKNGSSTNEYVGPLFDKKFIELFLELKGCPVDEILKIDWESCEYDENLIEFHNPEELPEEVDLYMSNGDIFTVEIYLDEEGNLDRITNRRSWIIE